MAPGHVPTRKAGAEAGAQGWLSVRTVLKCSLPQGQTSYTQTSLPSARTLPGRAGEEPPPETDTRLCSETENHTADGPSQALPAGRLALLHLDATVSIFFKASGSTHGFGQPSQAGLGAELGAEGLDLSNQCFWEQLEGLTPQL